MMADALIAYINDIIPLVETSESILCKSDLVRFLVMFKCELMVYSKRFFIRNH